VCARRGRNAAPWDLLAFAATVVIAAALLLLAVLLVLVLRENDAIVAMLATIARRATDLRLEAVRAALPASLAGSLQPTDGAAPAPPQTLTYLGAAGWVVWRAIVLLSGFAAVPVTVLCSLALLDRGSALLPRALLLAGVSSLPFGLLYAFVLFGGAPFLLTLPALALSGVWLGALVVALLGRAEQEQDAAHGPATAA
jgi:hypothetical protein